MSEEWRCVNTDLHRADLALAIDEAIMLARSKAIVPNTLRFYSFSPNAALVEFHQIIDAEVDMEACKKLGFDYNRRVTGGGAILIGEEVSIEDVKRAIKRGYEESLGIELKDGDLTDLEIQMAEKIRRKYASEEWIYLRRSPVEAFGEALRKTPRGMLRIYASLDGEIIKNIMMTSDFFAFP